MSLAAAHGRRALDVVGDMATGSVRIPEPDLTGVGTKSLEGWVMGLATSREHLGQFVLVDSIRSKRPLRFLAGDPCLTIAEGVDTAMEAGLVPWITIKAGADFTGTSYAYFVDHSLEPTVHGPEWITSPAPIAWEPEIAVPTTVEPLETTQSAELVEAAQQIRESTKLPVQDLSAMLGIKRRQFYNWLDGTLPPSDRIRRLFALRDAASRLSAAVGGEPRRVRLALLAPIAGDSVFDAFVSDDAGRISAAVDAAERTLAEGNRLVRRVPPSARAQSSPGAADELRFERDALGLYPDPPALGEEVLGNLTPREREILQLLADGMSNVNVAQKLSISQKTVESHVRHILAKLAADTGMRAVDSALREAMVGLVGDSDDQT